VRRGRWIWKVRVRRNASVRADLLVRPFRSWVWELRASGRLPPWRCNVQVEERLAGSVLVVRDRNLAAVWSSRNRDSSPRPAASALT
jgi:hypothetical protein